MQIALHLRRRTQCAWTLEITNEELRIVKCRQEARHQSTQVTIFEGLYAMVKIILLAV